MFRALTFMMLMVVSGLAYAQPFGGGMRSGLNASQIAGDGMSGYHKAGFAGAFSVYYYTSENFRLQFELGYSRKGSARRPDPEDPMVTQFLRRLNYVELPLLAQFELGLLRLEAGFSADLLTTASEKIDGYPNNNFNRAEWKNITFNGIIGAQYKLTERLSLIVRSTNALHSIRNNSVAGNVRRFSRKKYGEYNDVLFFGLGWEMNASGKK